MLPFVAGTRVNLGDPELEYECWPEPWGGPRSPAPAPSLLSELPEEASHPGHRVGGPQDTLSE